MHNLSYDKCINAAAACNRIETFLFFINKKTVQVTYLYIVYLCIRYSYTPLHIIIDYLVNLLLTIGTYSKGRILLLIESQ